MNERNGALVRQKFRQYLLPTLLTSLAFSTGGLLETVLVGHLLEDRALEAIALAEPIATAIDTLYLLFSVGGVTCATVALGKLDSRKANLIFTLSVMGGVAAMMMLWLFLRVFLDPLTLMLTGGDAELADLTASYLRPVLLVGPALMFSCAMADFINTDGRPRYAALIFITANLIRLLLGYGLMRYGNAGLPGAGFAMTAGYVFCCLLVIPYLFQKRRCFRFVCPRRNEWKEMRRILKAGLSTGWLGLCEVLCCSVLIVLVVTHMGYSSLPILIVCFNITAVADIFIDGVTDTLIPMTGVLYGEGDRFGIRQILKLARKLLMTASTALMLLFLLAPGYAGLLFGIDSPEIQQKLMEAVRLYVLYLPLYAMSILLQYYYNTIGRVYVASILAGLKSLVFVVLFAVLLVHKNSGLLWLCYLCAEVCALLVILFLCRRLQKKENLSDLLLMPFRSSQKACLDVTIKANANEAVSLSKRMIEFGLAEGIPKNLITLIAVAAEEMAISSAHYAHNDSGKGLIDVAVRVTDRRIYVRFRDNGTHFNPVEYLPPDERCIADGIVLMKKLSSSIQYMRQLGFNTTCLTFDR